MATIYAITCLVSVVISGVTWCLIHKNRKPFE
jgi:hypothetical protein